MRRTKVPFETFLSQLKETNQTLEFFCDFQKISRNVEGIKLSLCMLNSLLGSQDLRKSVNLIWQRDKTAFEVLEILIAVRNKEQKKYLDQQGNCAPLKNLFSSVDGILTFLEGTGLAEVFRSKKINDLVDYVFGIETGLDSNARKNRSGHIMEDSVAQILAGHGVNFRPEVYSSEWPEVTRVLGDDKKRFDFVIYTASKIFLIEVNFYSSGGSKLNEVARSYSEIAPKINSVPNFEFVWVTDGIGWYSAKNKLQEAYNIIPRIYNLTGIHDFLNELMES